LEFSGESFVTNPAGEVIAQSPAGVDHILMVDIDLDQVASSHARKLFSEIAALKSIPSFKKV
jgi:predicted amidohydrolase